MSSLVLKSRFGIPVLMARVCSFLMSRQRRRPGFLGIPERANEFVQRDRERIVEGLVQAFGTSLFLLLFLLLGGKCGDFPVPPTLMMIIECLRAMESGAQMGWFLRACLGCSRSFGVLRPDRLRGYRWWKRRGDRGLRVWRSVLDYSCQELVSRSA
jgi:hypothetical protein